MPFIPQGPPPPGGGGLALPQGPLQPPTMPAPQDVPPAASAIQGLAPLVPVQQSILDAVKQKLAEQTMAAAMQAVQGMPNPVAEAAQTEPSPPVSGGQSPQDLQSQGL